jgi:ferredoxin-nitrite reductase
MSEYLTHTVPIEDAKIRLYWSACVKGCGVHGAGDLGFVGCKVPKNGKTVLGVDIFIGGTLSSEGGEGHLLLKGVVLEEAKEYVAELMREYRDLKIQKESLEHFITRLQIRYSNYAIGFVMRWNRLMEQNSLELPLHFNLKTHGGSHKESDEIFEFGLALVHSITKTKAYEVEDPFIEGKKAYIFDTKSLNASYRSYKEIIEKMLQPNPMLRYQVFTEIVNDIEKIPHESK